MPRYLSGCLFVYMRCLNILILLPDAGTLLSYAKGQAVVGQSLCCLLIRIVRYCGQSLCSSNALDFLSREYQRGGSRWIQAASKSPRVSPARSLGYHLLVSIMCYLPDKVVVVLAVFGLEIRTVQMSQAKAKPKLETKH